MWLSRLAYLSQIFCRLSELNNSLQGFRTTPFSVHDETKASRKIWFHYQRNRKWTNVFLSIFGSFVGENEIQLSPKLAANVKELCENLIADFTENFTENQTSEFWIRDNFSIEDVLPESLRTNGKDAGLELPCDGSLQQMFKKMDLTEFWLARRKEYPIISDQAIKCLSVFSTAYICECGYSSMTYIKNKCRKT
jgi:hypothetical protein